MRTSSKTGRGTLCGNILFMTLAALALAGCEDEAGVPPPSDAGTDDASGSTSYDGRAATDVSTDAGRLDASDARGGTGGGGGMAGGAGGMAGSAGGMAGGSSLTTITPASFSIVHRYNMSPCPTPLGTLTITNTTNTPVMWSINTNELSVSVSPMSGTLAGGASVQVTVRFECVVTGADGQIALTVRQGQTVQTRQIPIKVTVTGAP